MGVTTLVHLETFGTRGMEKRKWYHYPAYTNTPEVIIFIHLPTFKTEPYLSVRNKDLIILMYIDVQF